MAATIAHFAPRVEALAARLPTLLDAAEPRADRRRGRATTSRKGVPEELAARVVTLDTLYPTLDIVEVAGATQRPVELVAEIYFELSTRLGLAVAARDDRAPAGRRALADAREGRDGRRSVGAAADDRRRSAERRRPTSPRGTSSLAAWQERNRRAIERAQRLLAELRAAPAADAAMLSVALRELRNLG